MFEEAETTVTMLQCAKYQNQANISINNYICIYGSSEYLLLICAERVAKMKFLNGIISL